MAERNFKVVVRSTEDGTGYSLAYGKRSKKLEVVATKEGHLFKATIGDRTITDQLKNIKAVFDTWARANYDGDTGDAIPSDGESPQTIAVESPARVSSAADELNDRQRGFFATLSTKYGQLSEWQRSQAKVELRAICGLKDNPSDTPKLSVPVKLPPTFKAGPPVFKPQETENEHDSESIGTDDTAIEPAACGEGQ